MPLILNRAKIAIAVLVLMNLNLLSGNYPAMAQTRQVRADLEKIFKREDVVGTFVMLDSEDDRLIIINPDRAITRFFPASSFKIANSLIALETGVIADEHEIIPYGGEPQPFKSWERDMSMRDAIRISNVPVYQQLARRIGYERYEVWLQKLDYGNRKVRDDRYRFWLDGPLAISAVEQVAFLSRLAMEKLPATRKSQKAVANLVLLEKSASAMLYGKTGWSLAAKPQVGWFVGWVAQGEKTFPFALNLEIRSRKDVDKRKKLAREFLHVLIGYGR